MVAVQALPSSVSVPHLRVLASPTRGAAPARTPVSTLARWQIALAIVVVAVALAVSAFLPAAGTSDLVAAPEVVVADAGDSMWSIAQAHAPAGTVSTYVERMVMLNGTALVSAGQHVLLPAD